MKKIIAAAALICIALVFLLEPLGLAWMSDNGLSSPIDITSNVHKSYFESGDGTKELKYDDDGDITAGPYEIKYPVQLYYFAWLQYLGYFNVDNDEDGKIDTVYFRVSADIDMTNTGDESISKFILPPIGTKEHPFLGNFNGEGHTIKNLTVENVKDSLTERPNDTDDFGKNGEVEIIGFFGVIGELAEGDYSYETQANEVKNVVLENLTVTTQTNNALIGLVAGYVNGLVDCVGVVGSKVNIKEGTASLSYTENMSDYSLIGYCTETYKDSVYVMDVMLNNPGISDKYTVVPEIGGDGENTGWGGSIAMKQIFSLMQNTTTTSNNNYTLERTDVVSLSNKTVTVSTGDPQQKNSAIIENFGSFVTTKMNYGDMQINFVSGAQKVTRFKYAYTENDVALYYITDGTNYLSFNGTNIINSTGQADATKWYVSNGTSGGVISTVVNGSVYYLTITDGSIAVIADVNADPSNLPSWTASGNTYAFNGTRILYDNGTWTVANEFKISYGNNYLTNNGNTGITSTTDVNDAAAWRLNSVNDGYQVSTVINNTTYYLGYTTSNSGWGQQTPNGLSLRTTPTTWQFADNRLYAEVSSYWYTTNYYVRYNSGWTISNSTNQSNLTFTSTTNANVDINSSGTTAKEIVCEKDAYIDNSTENYTYNADGEKVVTGAGITYIPLSFTENNEIKDSNTGYIIGSQWGAIEKNQYDANGNIRISRYGASSLGGNTDNGGYTKPYTISYKTSGKFKTMPALPDKKEDVSSEQKQTLANLGLVKYIDCYTDFRKSLNDNYCYGLHFMNASVSMSNIMETTVRLKGRTIDNYQMPTNCIDFNLYERGFINFVGGSYYTAEDPDNNSFFSIYQIFRDPNDETKIVAIKEISKIYAELNSNNDIDTNKEYIYTYTDGSTSGTLTDSHKEVFNCRWITHPDDTSFYGTGVSGDPTAWTNSRTFYYEVPVNAGEYAIGSTDGRMGAYLVFLDLAANAQLIERTKEYEEIYENKAAGDIPGGVEILEKNENGYDADNDGKIDVDPTGSAFPSINQGTSGEITFDKDGNTVTHSAKGGTTAEYIGTDAELKDGNGNLMTVPFVETKIERTTYRDYNINTGVYMVTIITKTTVTKEDGTKTVKYTKQVTATDADGNVIADQTYDAKEVSEADAVPDTEDTGTNDAENVSAGNKLIDLAFAYGQEVSVTVTYLYTPAETDENGTVTKPATYLITIVNEGAEDVDVKAILTADGVSSGITFIISDGTTETTLTNSTAAQTVTIKGTGATEGGNTEGGENTEDPAA